MDPIGLVFNLGIVLVGDFQGPPIMGPLTHTIPIRIPYQSHYWESLESPLIGYSLGWAIESV